MRALVLILALVAAPALAQQGVLYPGGVSGMNGVQAPAPVVLRAPLTTSGAPFECGANAVACVTWNGSALVDAKGNSWTQNGTVPQVAANASPSVPGTAGAGVFSLTNYYSLGTGADVMDSTGDFLGCVTFTNTSTTNGTLISDSAGTDGWALLVLVSGTQATFRVYSGGSFTDTSDTGLVLGGPNEVCYGRDGTNSRLKVNGRALQTTAAVSYTPDTATAARIGRDASAGAATGSVVYALLHDNSTPSDTLFTRIWQRSIGMIGSFGEPLTVTRSTTGTYLANGLMWTAPAGALRSESAGSLIETARTNTILRSADPANAAWTATNLTCAGTGTAPDGTATAETCANTATNAQHKVTQGYTGTAVPWTASAYCQAGTANFLAIALENTTFSWCNCSTGAAGTNGAGNTLAITGPVNGFYRCAVTRTMTAAGQTAAFAVSEADNTISYAGTSKTVLVWGTQVEVGAYATSYIATVGTTVARSADALSFVSPTAGSNDHSFSFDACFLGANTAYSGIFPTQINVVGVSNEVFRVAWDNTANWNCIARGTGDVGQVAIATLGDSWAAGACRHVIGSYDGSTKKLTCTVKNGASVVGTETTPATTNLITDLATLHLGRDNTNAGRETGGRMSNLCQSISTGGCN